jgi:hypothetical protein
MFRGEDLKGGYGNPDWLRLFMLMSAEFAVAERCPEPPNVPAQHLRIAEIRVLNKTLNAAKVLDDMSHLVRWTDEVRIRVRDASHYLIRYNTETREVRVALYFKPIMAVSSYDEAEFLDFKAGDRDNIVLVEVDKIENLKEAYPNYFGDVQLFRKQLTDITKGISAQEYTFPPRETAPPPHKEKPDYAWLRKRKHVRWK